MVRKKSLCSIVKTADPQLTAFAAQCRARLDRYLEDTLPATSTHPAQLHEAMRYAVEGEGKRIRPMLVYAGGLAVGARQETLDAPACAIELIHAYSLVHDDLPAMDDDDLRRGRPSCHRAFGEATAILAGDALQSLAFQVLSNNHMANVSDSTRLKMIKTLALASGSRGMAGGQAIDLAATGQSQNIAELEDMHIHKTGALIRASLVLGALHGTRIDSAQLDKLDHYAKCIGLAFQIRDDILDVESDSATLGKQQGADVAHNKPTYVSLLGVDGARTRLDELLDDALAALHMFDQSADLLREIARYIAERKY